MKFLIAYLTNLFSFLIEKKIVFAPSSKNLSAENFLTKNYDNYYKYVCMYVCMYVCAFSQTI